jgi:MoaA/NifB/PqqE/SkfB family radical SAM enzyme
VIDVSRILARGGARGHGGELRYSADARFPVVVWHMTDRCNLKCRHCYAAGAPDFGARMSAADETDFLRLLAKVSAPALLMSGGEPLLHPNFWSRLALAKELGLRVIVSTNGVLIDAAAARELGDKASYVGVSLDGPRELHDRFRGVRGAFDASIGAIRLLASGGCRVGLRVTLASPVLECLDEMFGLAESLPISRICFYHFMPAGRGASDVSLPPGDPDEARAIERIIEWADGASGPPEILTVGDRSDNVRLYKYLQSRRDGRLEAASRLMWLAASKPHGILSVRWDGGVYRNQFMWDERLGMWSELDGIAAGVATPAALADECGACAWAGKICGGRQPGFGRRCSAGAPGELA